MHAMVINIPVAQADPYAYPYEDGSALPSGVTSPSPMPLERMRSATRSIVPSKSGSPIFATSPISSSF